MDEEDLFVVIVGDNGQLGSADQAPIQVKEEKIEVVEDLPMDLKQFIEMISPKLEMKEEKIEYDDYEAQCESYLESSDSEDANYCDGDNSMGEKPRHRMVKPSLRVSLVQSLKKQHRTQEQLIEALVAIMKSTKPPPPPQDYYILEGINLKCLYCRTVSETIGAAQRHYQDKHGPRYLKCLACGVDFRSKGNLYKHEKRCIAPYVSIVLKARARSLERKSKSRPYLYRPPPTEKPKKVLQFQCSQCPSVFRSKKALESHLNHHNGERPYKCSICPCAYTSPFGLSRHFKSHSDDSFICDHCGKEFNTKLRIISHMITHLPEKKYKCQECGKRYAYKNALTIHVNSKHRLLPLPCACQICPKRYPKMSSLKDHMKKIHGLSIISRRMYYDTLPTLTDTQMKLAKVVRYSDTKPNVTELS